MIQNCRPTSPLPTGMRRGFPVFRPVVSRSARPGGAMPTANRNLTGGLSKYFCRTWTIRRFIGRRQWMGIITRNGGDESGDGVFRGFNVHRNTKVESRPRPPSSATKFLTVEELVKVTTSGLRFELFMTARNRLFDEAGTTVS